MIQPKNMPYIRYVPIIIVAFFLYKIVNQTNWLMSAISTMSSILLPIIWGIVIAYLLNPIMQLLEKRYKMKRGLSILIIYVVLMFMIVGSLTVVIPKLIANVVDIITELPRYTEIATTWYEKRMVDFQAIEAFANTYDLSIKDYFEQNLAIQLQVVSDQLQSFILDLGKALFDITSGIFKFILGLVMSIYMLKDKEVFNKGTKKILHAYVGPQKAHHIIELGRDINRVFSRYLIGKTIDSIIIGIICFVGLAILNVRFALLLSIIVGITNMIPTFGPFIGAIPAIVITLFYSPIQALWVALFILVLQQLDGYYIGPKILGDSVGVSAFWIIFAIIVGGGLFGVVGMLLCVPLLAVMRNLNNDYMQKKFDKYEKEAAALLTEDLLEH